MGPWRVGPETGERGLAAGAVLHSDALYSALTHAMSQLDLLDEWIAATAGNSSGSQVRFSSCFPFAGQLLFLAPPKTLWPPPASLKVRWKAARLVPASMVSLLLNNRKIREDDWTVDGPSECLMPVIRGQVVSSPFRPTLRSAASVDRLGEGVAPHRTACVEFHKDAGMWAAVDFTSQSARDRWTRPLQGALRLLADTGLGGGRSRGWGRFEQPEFIEGPLQQLLFGRHAQATAAGSGAYWLLSLFTPSSSEDAVDWKQGNYEVALRNGRIESQAATGSWGIVKKSSKVVLEGSVLVAEKPLAGAAYDVAPEGFAHPVYRAGFALALPLAAARKVEVQIEESAVEAEPEPEPPSSFAAVESEPEPPASTVTEESKPEPSSGTAAVESEPEPPASTVTEESEPAPPSGTAADESEPEPLTSTVTEESEPEPPGSTAAVESGPEPPASTVTEQSELEEKNAEEPEQKTEASSKNDGEVV